VQNIRDRILITKMLNHMCGVLSRRVGARFQNSVDARYIGAGSPRQIPSTR
jgi:hypothetical protein